MMKIAKITEVQLHHDVVKKKKKLFYSKHTYNTEGKHICKLLLHTEGSLALHPGYLPSEHSGLLRFSPVCSVCPFTYTITAA